MIIDTSALVAILKPEVEGPRFASAIIDGPRCRMSAATYVEAVLVLHPLGLSAELDLFIHDVGIEVVDLTVEQALVAAAAARQFGRGYHPARLNFGDCFSYAIAKVSGEPLLFKGDDFGRTDIPVAA